MLGEKSDEGTDGVEAKGVVGEIDGVEVGALEEGSQEGGKGRGDLGEEAGGEDVGEVDGCEGCLGGEEGGEIGAGGDAEGVA